MPWGTAIIGAMFCAGVIILLQVYVTGTSAIDSGIKLGVPVAVVAVYVGIIAVSLFGK